MSIARVEVVLPGVLAEDAGGRRSLFLEVPAGPGARLGQVLDQLAAGYPLLGRRIRDETGTVRPHVNLFVDGDHIRDHGELQMPVRDGATVLVLPNVSGG
jgi:sulfur-carrier protein